MRCDGKTKPPVEYRGPNAAEHMLRSLMNEQDQILKTLANPKPMKMTQKDQLDYANAKDCHICKNHSLFLNSMLQKICMIPTQVNT